MGVTKDRAVLMADSAPDGIMNSEYGELVRSIRDLNVSAHGLLNGTGTFLNATESSFETVGSVEGGLFEDTSVIANALKTLIEQEDELVRAAELLNESVTLFLIVDESGPIGVGEIGETLKNWIESLSILSAFVVSAPRIAGEVFGIDGETSTYLLLGQTSDELRAAGGFTSNVWLLTFQGGALINNEFINVATFEDRESLSEYPEAVEELRLHMGAGLTYVRDVGWNPNFPSVGRLAIELIEIERDVQINGVISLTQWALVDLTAALDGLETDSGILSSAELLSEIERTTDEQGTEALTSFFESLLKTLSGEKIQTRGINLLRTITMLFDSKDLMLYSRNQVTQELISDIGWDGGLPVVSHDRLAIVDSNVGWSRVDRNIEREFTYEVDLSDVNRPQATLTLTYTNKSTIGDDDCGIQDPGEFQPYEVLIEGCYWNYLRIYIPIGALLLGGDDLPLDAGAIASRLGGLRAGSRTLDQLFDDNGDYLSGLLTVKPRSSRDVELRYTLPTGVLNKDGGDIEYVLDVLIQAGTRRRIGTVAIDLPAGYEVVEVEPAGRSSSQGRVLIDIDTAQDEMIRLRIRDSGGTTE
jgi:hypothetical protein